MKTHVRYNLGIKNVFQHVLFFQEVGVEEEEKKGRYISSSNSII